MIIWRYTSGEHMLSGHEARMFVRRRDGERCWICGTLVPENRLDSDPEQATLDHVIERAAGGSDDVENLRLAHRGCNERRGAEFKRQREGSAAPRTPRVVVERTRVPGYFDARKRR